MSWNTDVKGSEEHPERRKPHPAAAKPVPLLFLPGLQVLLAELPAAIPIPEQELWKTFLLSMRVGRHFVMFFAVGSDSSL